MPLLNIPFGPEATKQLISGVEKTSAFLQASRQVDLPANGSEVPILGKATAGQVIDGDIKPHSELTASTNVIKPVTIATIMTLHKHLRNDLAGITAAVVTQGRTALAEALDTMIATGVDPLGTAAPENFGSFEGIDAVNVTGRQSWVAAQGKVNAGGYKPEALVLTSAEYFALLGETNELTGAPVHQFTGDVEKGTFNGIPYYVYDSTDAIGVLGSFKSAARWGTVGGVEVNISDEATVTIGGTLKSLWERNLFAVRVEARYGFNYLSEDNFVQFGADASAS